MLARSNSGARSAFILEVSLTGKLISTCALVDDGWRSTYAEQAIKDQILALLIVIAFEKPATGAAVFVDAVDGTVAEGNVPFVAVPGFRHPPFAGGTPGAGRGNYFSLDLQGGDLGWALIAQDDLGVFQGAVAAECELSGWNWLPRCAEGPFCNGPWWPATQSLGWTECSRSSIHVNQDLEPDHWLRANDWFAHKTGSRMIS
jgi:hypothetical protein